MRRPAFFLTATQHNLPVTEAEGWMNKLASDGHEPEQPGQGSMDSPSGRDILNAWLTIKAKDITRRLAGTYWDARTPD